MRKEQDHLGPGGNDETANRNALPSDDTGKAGGKLKQLEGSQNDTADEVVELPVAAIMLA